MSEHFSCGLVRLGACSEAVAWASTQPNDPAAAWTTCQRGDWLMWLLGRMCSSRDDDSHRRIVAAACECARLARSLAVDPRVTTCLTITERWAAGDPTVTIGEIERAADGVYAAAGGGGAAYAAIAAAGAAVGRVGRRATHAAGAATGAAATHAAVGRVGCHATYSATAAAAPAATLAACADIVRRHFPEPPVI